MNSTHHRSRQRGVSLVETMIVTSTVAVLTGMVAPGFDGALQRRHLEGAATQLETDVHHTRMLAVARNAPLRISFESGSGGSCYVIHSGSANQCGCSTGTAACTGAAVAERVVHFRAGESVGAGVEHTLGVVRPAARHEFADRDRATDDTQRQGHPSGGEHHGACALVLAGARAERLQTLLMSQPTNGPRWPTGGAPAARDAPVDGDNS